MVDFTPTEWQEGEEGGTPITADQLNRMERGIEDDATAATAAQAAAATAQSAASTAQSAAATAQSAATAAQSAASTAESDATTAQSTATAAQSAAATAATAAAAASTAAATAQGAANAAYVKPGGGIPAADLTTGVQAALTAAGAAYVKPGSGIPKTDLTSAVQASLGLADTAYQAPAVVAAGVDQSAARAAAGAAQGLTPTAVKTSAYTAAPGDLVLIDASSGAVTITLPNAPADNARICAKVILPSAATGSTFATVVASGSDVFNRAGGGTTISLSLPNQALTVQYALATHQWIVIADDFSLSQLDARYTATGGYVKPGTGIPSTDLTAAVQTSLGKADSAYQAPAVVGAGSTQALARAAIGAGTSSLAVGTSSTEAKAGDYQPAAEDISNSTTVGRNVLKAANQAAARTAIDTQPTADPTFAGTFTASRVALGAGTTSPAKPYNALYTISATDIPATGNVIGHSRLTVFNGDWAVKATVTINGTGGTVAWTIGGLTANIAPTATASAVQTALTALATVGAGNLTVTGGPGGASPVPYVVTYSPAFIATNRYRALTVDGTNLTGGTHSADITWNGTWGVDTGFLWGENSYTVTGTDALDGNGISVLFGGLFEADQRSTGTIGLMVGLAAEASFTLASAGGFVDTIIGMMVSRSQHKDNALQYQGTAREVYGIQVGGVQNSRSFTDGVTTNGSASVTSITGQFSATDVSKVVTGTGIPTNTYIVSVTSTTLTLSNACTATATGVTVTIQGTHQCTNAYTAWFGPGTVQANGALKVNGWKDEAQLVVTGWNNQTNNLQEWWFNSNRIGRFTTQGALNMSAGLGLFEGNPNAASIGVNSTLSKPGMSWGFPFDVALTHDASGIVGVAGGLRLGVGYTTVAGSRLWSGSGAPSIAASIAGDFYFRTDTPTVANQRIYAATAANTWTGIL